MRSRNGRQVPTQLKVAAERFAQWRRTRALGTRIPPHLWSLAVKLAASYGVCRTASTLRVSYYDLKRRLDEQVPLASPRVVAARRPTFVELPATTLAAVECVIELDDPRGRKLRVHLKGGATPDLAALARGFWNAEE
jgi:hypothetical protein